MEETVRTNLLGGTAGRAPPPENLLAQATAHAAVKKAPPSTSGAWGEGEEGVANPGGGALRRPRSRGARGAVAPHGDVGSSWSRGLPPAADVRTVNNRERSVEGGIPRRSVRRPSSRTPPRPGLLRSPGCWGRGEGERGVLRREAAAQARVARGAASSPDLSSRSRAAASQSFKLRKTPRRAPFAGYPARASRSGLGEAALTRRLYPALRRRNVCRAGAGAIGRAEGMLHRGVRTRTVLGVRGAHGSPTAEESRRAGSQDQTLRG